MKVQKITAGKIGTTTVNDELFSCEADSSVVSQAVRVYLSNQRQGTSKVQSRSEVSVTHKKLYKQKGTGGARHGSKNAPIFVGGGVAHGPNGTQNWNKNLPTKVKRVALHAALTRQQENVYICDAVESLDGKTKSAIAELSPVLEKSKKGILVIVEKRSPEVVRSLRNIPGVHVVSASRVTALEVAQANEIVSSSIALTALQTRVLGTN